MAAKMSMTSTDAQYGFTLLKITRDEYASLVNTAQQYDTLCRNLISGGVNKETLELLSTQSSRNSESGATNNSSKLATFGLGSCDQTQGCHTLALSSQTSHARPYDFILYANSESNYSTGDGTQVNDSESNSISSAKSRNESISADGVPSIQVMDDLSKPAVEPTATRTVQLLNLAKGTTIADITSVVRGGPLVNIYSRSKDNMASVSFVHSSDAHAFYQHVQTIGLYINNTKVDIRWDDRQFFVAGHIAQKISQGASRNLVIRHCNPNLTEREIRNDLEHIHHLEVVQILFLGGHCFISTNSIAAAMFARTCMMSRLKYRGPSRIEWDVDECAQLLHKIPIPKRMPPIVPRGRGTASSAMNRFHLLSFDE